MSKRRHSTPAVRALAQLAASALLLAGCHDNFPSGPKKQPVYLLEPIQCVGNVAARALTCTSGDPIVAPTRAAALERARHAAAPGAHPVSRALIGGQGIYVKLASANFFYDNGLDRVNVDVTLQNLTADPMGSTDGVAYDGEGADIFFAVQPVAPAVIANATGTGTFTAPFQPYFQIPEMVPANGTSAPVPWKFDLNGAPSFAFTVYVSTAMPSDPALVTIPPHNFTYVSVGGGLACAIRAGGNRAYCWGANDFGQLGNGRAPLPNSPVPFKTAGNKTFQSVSGGGYFSGFACGVEAGSLLGNCWGPNSYWALGDSTVGNQLAPHRILGGIQWRVIRSGGNHACGIEDESGTVYCWGYNANGQNGDGSTNRSHGKPSPVVIPDGASLDVVVGNNHACALTQYNQTYCWGDDSQGQLGDNNQFGSTWNPSPILVYGSHYFTALAAGGEQTCGLEGPSVYCWGKSTISFRNVRPTLETAAGIPPFQSMSVSFTHACAVGADQSAWCWGDNTSGALGTGDNTNSISPRRVSDGNGPFSWASIAAGAGFTCGLDTGGVGHCWGFNNDGELGDGSLFVYPNQPTTSVAGDTWTAISAGYDFACGLSASSPGTSFCWGNNASDELGTGIHRFEASPQGVIGNHQFPTIAASLGGSWACALDGLGVAYCWGNGSYGNLGDGSGSNFGLPTPVAFLNSYDQLSAGSNHACALLTGSGNRGVRCWGNNYEGELGAGTVHTYEYTPVSVTGAVNLFTSVTAGGNHSCALQSSGAAYCWGDGGLGQLGDNNLSAHTRSQPFAVVGGHNFSAISAGNSFTCGIEAVNHQAYCWGFNGSGQLGDGTLTKHATPIAVSAPLAHAAVQFSSIAVGTSSVCGLEQGTGTAFCWGENVYGGIGDGTYTTRKIPTLVAGSVTSFAQISVNYGVCAVTASNDTYCWGYVDQFTPGTTTPTFFPVP
jgi:alpha-tubulin suppressor-like RCC1 family protein